MMMKALAKATNNLFCRSPRRAAATTTAAALCAPVQLLPAAAVAAVESPPYLALVELGGSQSLITRIFNPWFLP